MTVPIPKDIERKKIQDFLNAHIDAGTAFTVDERKDGMVAMKFTGLDGETYRVWITEDRFKTSVREH